jgi:hypothetical protein
MHRMPDTLPTASEPRESRRPSPTGVHDLFAGYAKEERPLVAYAELVGLYNLALAMFLAAAKGAGRPLPQRVALADILLVGVATFKLSRLMAKDLVTSPLRAPFTTFEGLAGEGEVNEKPRGEGMQRALGELFTCPFCLGTWVAAFLAYALVLSPPITRLIAAILASHALADFLQLAYGATAESVQKLNSESE